MKALNISSLLCLTAFACAAAPSIGIIRASGHFTVEGSEVWGNSTLFDGTAVETQAASSELALSNGVRVQLGAASRARVWQNHLRLEKGTGQISGEYAVETGGLQIKTSPGSRIRIGLNSGVDVSAVTGSAKVNNGAGLLLAALPAGRSLSFAPQAAQSNTIMRTGCLVYKDGQFLVQDENTLEVIEVHGANFAANIGNRVEITGTPATTPTAIATATRYVNVASLTARSQGGCLSVASALDARTDVPQITAPPKGAPPNSNPVPTKASGGGMSTGAKVAIIAAIGGGGAGAALALSGGKKSTSP